MAETFRLYGPEVGFPTAIIDADVTGVSLDGTIQLTPQNTTLSAFGINPERLHELADDNLAYDKANVNVDDPIWDAIADVENRYENAEDDQEAFVEATRVLFVGAA
jgi:hypothetical protein